MIEMTIVNADELRNDDETWTSALFFELVDDFGANTVDIDFKINGKPVELKRLAEFLKSNVCYLSEQYAKEALMKSPTYNKIVEFDGVSEEIDRKIQNELCWTYPWINDE